MNEQHVIGPSRIETGSSMAEILVGVSAVGLAIVGLANIYPWVLASIATIALGAAFIFEIGSVGQRFSSLAPEDRAMSGSSGMGNITAEFMLGCAGIALGILALIGIVPTVLVPIAVALYGVALFMESGARADLGEFESEFSRSRSQTAVETASPILPLAGLGALTLGILGIVRIVPLTLSLVGLLLVGAAVLIGCLAMFGTRKFQEKY